MTFNQISTSQGSENFTHDGGFNSNPLANLNSQQLTSLNQEGRFGSQDVFFFAILLMALVIFSLGNRVNLGAPQNAKLPNHRDNTHI
mmetsp:Transcript_27511/g.26570  ORF Transcript_27511/g.26570 Transcript_27511/m.26570 type:complete len:87 (+) Transcript_27511:81-341(+)